MQRSGIWVAFLDIHASSMAMSIMEGRPIKTDFDWGQHWTFNVGDALIHVFVRGRSATRDEIQDLLNRWDRGDFKNLIKPE